MKIVGIVFVSMVCMAMLFYTFGIPWTSDYFGNFNSAIGVVNEYTTPIIEIGNTLRETYGAVSGVINDWQIWNDNLDLWRGEISKWAIECGLKSPYQMNADEVYSAFNQLDKYLAKSFTDEERRDFIFKCGLCVYFVIDEQGNMLPTYTGVPSTSGALFGCVPNRLDKIFKYIANYSWGDCLKNFVATGYVNALGSLGSTGAPLIGSLPMNIGAEEKRVYVWYYSGTTEVANGYYGEDLSSIYHIRDIIPFSAEAFMKRCYKPLPDADVETSYPVVWTEFDDVRW